MVIIGLELVTCGGNDAAGKTTVKPVRELIGYFPARKD